MSITETINEAKKELTNDEHMLASAFKLEKLYKKHKLKLFTVIAVAVLYFGGTAIMDTIKEQKLVAANNAYLTLAQDANNTAALTELKTNNPALFELYSYQKAIKNSDTATLKTLSMSQNEIIADMSAYHLAILEGKPSQSELNSDISLINNAYLLIKEGKITEAKEQLESISEDSPVHNIAQMIKHYSIKGQ
ncbi:hypothetical protein KKC13_02570 [bacterium]|nr:hypothetical protein [bacterium]MBU1958963.1 hypothetical protein [bacterium]